MGHSLSRRGRFLSAATIGLVAAIGFSLRARNSFSGSALAAGDDVAAPKAEVSSSEGDKIAIKGDGNAQNVDDPDTLDLRGLQSKFQSIARRVAPTVVSISAAEAASDIDSTVRADEMNTQKLQSLLDKTTRTIGTGFIVDADGFILTNEHVIEDSQQFWVTTDDHKVFPAIVVGADPRADLAVLKIPASHLPVVKFASSPCQRGEWAVTLGNPYGLATEGQMALSVGVVSATDRSLPKLASKEDRLYSDLIQTTAQINPGNSGGPLIDVDGEIIGIDTAVILPQKQTNGIGFAIPITPQLLDEIVQLEQGREVVYGYMGVTVSAATPQQRHDSGISDPIGVCVDSIEKDSPAAAVNGLKTNDLIVQVNGETASGTDRFVRLVGAAPIGREAILGIVRGGKRMVVKLTPIKRPVQYAVTNQNQRLYWRGMVLGPVPTNWPPAAGNEKRFAGILVVGIEDDSPLKRQGVCAGTVITAIAGRSVATMLELQRILNDIPPDQCTVQTAAATTEVAAAKK